MSTLHQDIHQNFLSLVGTEFSQIIELLLMASVRGWSKCVLKIALLSKIIFFMPLLHIIE